MTGSVNFRLQSFVTYSHSLQQYFLCGPLFCLQDGTKLVDFCSEPTLTWTTNISLKLMRIDEVFERVLSLYDSSNIKKFRLHCEEFCVREADFSRIDARICTTIEGNVVELDLCLWNWYLSKIQLIHDVIGTLRLRLIHDKVTHLRKSCDVSLGTER